MSFFLAYNCFLKKTVNAIWLGNSAGCNIAGVGIIQGRAGAQIGGTFVLIFVANVGNVGGL